MHLFFRILRVVLPALVLCAALVGVVFQPAFAANRTALASRYTLTTRLSQGSCPATIGDGNTGQLVMNLQGRLNQLGAHLAVDGIFGPLTQAAVVQFQRSFGIAVDGVVGPQTWIALGFCQPIKAIIV